MKLEDYEGEIKERLKDPNFAAEYLTAALDNEEAFLIALKDVIDAREEAGVSHLLSDNLTLTTFASILKSMGFSLQIKAM